MKRCKKDNERDKKQITKKIIDTCGYLIGLVTRFFSERTKPDPAQDEQEYDCAVGGIGPVFSRFVFSKAANSFS